MAKKSAGDRFNPARLNPGDVASLADAMPALLKCGAAATVADYFKDELTPFISAHDSNDSAKIRRRIAKEAARLYGRDTGDGVAREFESFPVAECNTHLWFPRDTSGVYPPDSPEDF